MHALKLIPVIYCKNRFVLSKENKGGSKTQAALLVAL
jgi:hypothetical protein